jgi:hypothetical protein
MRQRGAGEGIEGFMAGSAAIAGQSMGVTPMHARRVMTVRATGFRIYDRANDILRAVRLVEPLDGLLLLGGCEFVGLQEPAVKIIGAHDGTSTFFFVLSVRIGRTNT